MIVVRRRRVVWITTRSATIAVGRAVAIGSVAAGWPATIIRACTRTAWSSGTKTGSARTTRTSRPASTKARPEVLQPFHLIGGEDFREPILDRLFEFGQLLLLLFGELELLANRWCEQLSDFKPPGTHPGTARATWTAGRSARAARPSSVSRRPIFAVRRLRIGCQSKDAGS